MNIFHTIHVKIGKLTICKLVFIVMNVNVYVFTTIFIKINEFINHNDSK